VRTGNLASARAVREEIRSRQPSIYDPLANELTDTPSMLGTRVIASWQLAS
jgi:hypothetical protein